MQNLAASRVLLQFALTPWLLAAAMEVSSEYERPPPVRRHPSKDIDGLVVPVRHGPGTDDDAMLPADELLEKPAWATSTTPAPDAYNWQALDLFLLLPVAAVLLGGAAACWLSIPDDEPPKEKEAPAPPLKVSNFEFLFDVIVVVVLHVLADSMLAADPAAWLKTAVKVIFVWWLWSHTATYVIEARLSYDHKEDPKRSLSWVDALIVLMSTLCLYIMARASKYESDKTFILAYCFGIVQVTFFGYLSLPCRGNYSCGRGKALFIFVPLQVMVFAPVAGMGSPGGSSTTQQYAGAASGAMGLVACAALIHIMMQCCTACCARLSEEDGKDFGEVMQERLNLIVLLCIGGLVYPSAGAAHVATNLLSPDFLIGASSLLLAFICYCLFFAVQPSDWKPPTSQGKGFTLIALYIVNFMAIALQAMGAALIKIMSNDRGGNTLFYAAAALFVFATTCFMALGEFVRPLKCSVAGRGVARMFVVVALGVMPLLKLRLSRDIFCSAVIGFLSLLCIFELWASAEVSDAPALTDGKAADGAPADASSAAAEDGKQED